MSAQVDQAGIDYHVVLAQNALQQCLDMPELQAELICALIKQTSKSSPLPKLGVQVSTQKLLKKSVSVLLLFQFFFSQRFLVFCVGKIRGVFSNCYMFIFFSNIEQSKLFQFIKHSLHKRCKHGNFACKIIIDFCLFLSVVRFLVALNVKTKKTCNWNRMLVFPFLFSF